MTRKKSQAILRRAVCTVQVANPAKPSFQAGERASFNSLDRAYNSNTERNATPAFSRFYEVCSSLIYEPFFFVILLQLGY